MKTFSMCDRQMMTLVAIAYLASISGASPPGQGPRFVSEPSARIHFDNSTGAALFCGARGHPTPTIQWVTLDIEGGSPSGSVMDLPGLRRMQSDGTLVFEPFRAEQYRQDVHNAVYRCTASNRFGVVGSRDVHVRAVVHHVYKPQVYDEFVISGNVAVLRCSVPSFVREFVDFVSWHRDDGLAITRTSNRGKYSVLPTGELYIRNAGPSDRLGSYHCKTKHRLTGEVVTSASSGRLIIQAPQGAVAPRMTDTHPVVLAVEGQDIVELACAAQGFPVPSYRWYRELDGRLSDLTRDPRTAQVEGSLFLSGLVVKDSGKYFCLVNNTVGEEQVQTTLSVTGGTNDVIPFGV